MSKFVGKSIFTSYTVGDFSQAMLVRKKRWKAWILIMMESFTTLDNESDLAKCFSGGKLTFQMNSQRFSTRASLRLINQKLFLKLKAATFIYTENFLFARIGK